MSTTVSSGSADENGSSNRRKNRTRIDIETLRLHASSLVARLQSRVRLDTLRPLPMFLGVSPVGSASFCLSAQAFTPPVKKIDKASPEKIKSRVALNFAFFLTNYVMLAGMVALVVALMHPKMLFYVGIVYSLWAMHSFLIRNEVDVFGIQIHSLLSIQQRFYVLFVITAIVVIQYCLLPTIIFASITSVLVLLHAFLRDPKHIESMESGKRDGVDDDEEEELDSGASSSGSGSEVLVERPNRSRGDVV